MPRKYPVKVTLDVQRDDCLVSNSFSDSECVIDRLCVREGSTLHAVYIKDELDPSLLFSCEDLKIKQMKKGVVWIESPSCSICSLLARMQFVNILSIVNSGQHRMTLKMVLPSKSYLNVLKSELRREHIDFSVIDCVAFRKRSMTAREYEVLRIALEKRYFDCTNRTSLTELSKIAGVAPPSLSETLRRATKKAVEFYLERERK